MAEGHARGGRGGAAWKRSVQVVEEFDAARCHSLRSPVEACVAPERIGGIPGLGGFGGERIRGMTLAAAGAAREGRRAVRGTGTREWRAGKMVTRGARDVRGCRERVVMSPLLPCM